MKSYVDQDNCIACGMCVGACNALYEFNEDGKAECQMDSVPPEYEEDARQCAANCPTQAIQVTE